MTPGDVTLVPTSLLLSSVPGVDPSEEVDGAGVDGRPADGAASDVDEGELMAVVAVAVD